MEYIIIYNILYLSHVSQCMLHVKFMSISKGAAVCQPM